MFYAAFRESSLLKLPIEVLATIFKHMTKSSVRIWILKIVEDWVPHGHVHYVSEAVEVRRRADDDPARPQYLPEAFKDDVARYWQVLDDL